VPDEATGKSIDALRVGKLAGARGWADGFNDALTKIRQAGQREQAGEGKKHG
jgi:hypothetical protein